MITPAKETRRRNFSSFFFFFLRLLLLLFLLPLLLLLPRNVANTGIVSFVSFLNHESCCFARTMDTMKITILLIIRAFFDDKNAFDGACLETVVHVLMSTI